MTSYRIYILNPQDGIADEFEGSFDSDQAALERAENALPGGYAAEVWRGEHLVARLGGGLQLAEA